MSKTNTDTMPAGREMDALVAEKVMGLAYHKWQEGTITVCTGDCDPECVCDCVGEAGGFVCALCGSGREAKYWNIEKLNDANTFCGYHGRYSTDIAAAWEVVEYMRSIGFALDSYSSGKGEEGHSWTDAIFVKSLDEILVRAETFPLAVCRAALKAIGL